MDQRETLEEIFYLVLTWINTTAREKVSSQRSATCSLVQVQLESSENHVLSLSAEGMNMLIKISTDRGQPFGQ